MNATAKPLPELKERYRFAERLNYAGTWEHDCWSLSPDTPTYFKLFVGSDTYRNLVGRYNGTPEEFQRDVVGRLDTIVADNNQPVSRELVASFNRWRRDAFEARVERILSQPERYGITDRNDPWFVEPSIVVPAIYVPGEGWVRDGDVAQAKAEAGL